MKTEKQVKKMKLTHKVAIIAGVVVLITGLAILSTRAEQVKTADLNNDGTVSIFDLSVLLGKWNQTGTQNADLNGDNTVNIFDLSILLSKWGTNGAATPPATCDLNATTANFSAQVSAATAGQKICLATGNYGTWTGTNKAVTIAAQTGATASMAIDFRNGDRDFTLDGLTITDANIAGNGTYVFQSDAPHNITIKNSTFTGQLDIDYIIDNGTWPFTVLLDGNSHNNIIYNGGRIRLPYGNNEVNSGVIVQNSLLRGGPADGIQSGAGITILNNEFDNIEEGAYDEYHTDSIQLFGRGAARTIVRGNWFHNGADGVTAYDGLGNALIENNVIHSDAPGRCLEIYYDNAGSGNDPSTIQHNTLYGGCTIDLNTKSGIYPPGSGTVVRDNIVPGGIALQNGSTAVINTKNMCQSSCGTGNITGTAQFIGGATPTSWAGFKLAPGSPGVGAATDGMNIGIN